MKFGNRREVSKKDGANGISVNSLTLSLNAVLPKFICESRMYAGKARQCTL